MYNLIIVANYMCIQVFYNVLSPVHGNSAFMITGFSVMPCVIKKYVQNKKTLK